MAIDRGAKVKVRDAVRHERIVGAGPVANLAYGNHTVLTLGLGCRIDPMLLVTSVDQEAVKVDELADEWTVESLSNEQRLVRDRLPARQCGFQTVGPLEESQIAV